MKKTKQLTPNYWSVYKAINKQRFSKTREFTDKNTGKEMSYEFTKVDCADTNIFIQAFGGLLWLSPVLLIILISILYLPACPYSMFFAIGVVIAYHFAAMYYIIRGPHIEYTEVKKGFFS